MPYWAHSDRSGLPVADPEAKWQLLSEHLANVSLLARKIAESTLPNHKHFHDLAACCGLLHDFGKYTAGFQERILTGKGRCPHAFHGAAISYSLGSAGPAIRLPQVAFAIAGHHAGLPDRVGGEKALLSRIKEFQQEARGLLAPAMRDSELLRSFIKQPSFSPEKIAPDKFDLYTRMLFSCLVDADRFDSAGRPLRQTSLGATVRLEVLLAHLDQLSAKMPEGAVKAARQQVLKDGLAAASFGESMLSLSVPTGGGKTLAALAFALKRAVLFPESFRRIIVVIPYLSIIEQTAEVYGKIFGPDTILEHHSGACNRLTRKNDDHFAPSADDQDGENDDDGTYRNETENWDAPLIVTTSVRFFESLFSNHPSDLRRVHNIARSIVILDEVQTLPRRLLSPLLSVLRELSEDWGCTFVFSTATQPAFQRPMGSPADARLAPGTIREIIQQPQALRASLKRVRIEWEIDQPVDWPEVASRMLVQSQALCIVNLREHASLLFDEAKKQLLDRHEDPSGLFHLSTRMCAAHRLVVLERIRQRLQDKLTCWVVSTQLVEAGVDLDFPLVLRALGPLDAIFQAAGRADREGRITARVGKPGGQVVVFFPENHRVPPNEYRQATDLTQVLAKQRGASLQVDSIEAIGTFYERYYGESAPLGEDLQAMRGRAEFAKLADEFEMISSRTRDVFVPYDEASRMSLEELRNVGFLTRELRQKLQRSIVGLQPYEVDKARGVLAELRPGSGIWIAVEGAYSQTKGLKFQLEVEDLVVD